MQPGIYRKVHDGKRSEQAQRSQKEKSGGNGLMKTFSMPPDEVVAKLNALLDDPNMITLDAYSPDADSDANGRISFVEKHLRYLRTHKNVDPVHYISNLELMIKKR